METSGNALNKRFDRVVKDLAEEAPRLLLELAGVVPPGAAVTIRPLLPETALPIALPDYVAELVMPSGEKYVGHIEFLARYRKSYASTMARYGSSLAWQYRVVVESILLLLRPDGAPQEVPGFGEFVTGTTRITHPFRTVRLWELDPAPVIESGNPRLLPWAVLMRCPDEQAREIATAITGLDDELTLARFLTVGSIRYDRKQLEEMAGGRHMSLVEAIMEGSSLVRDATQRAAADGRIEEARRLLRRALKTRFPGLEDLPALDRIDSAEKLEALLFDEVLAGTERDSVERAILAAGRP